MEEFDLKSLYTNNLRELRDALGKSVAEMSKELNVSASTLTSYMNGARTMSLEMATHLYKIYDINLAWFVTGQGEMFNPKPENISSDIVARVENIERILNIK